VRDEDKLESWLEEDDIQRIWDVVHGNLPESAATADEIEEFSRLVTHAAMIKMGGTGYQGATLQ
jgi:hypothetical protein